MDGDARRLLPGFLFVPSLSQCRLQTGTAFRLERSSRKKLDRDSIFDNWRK